MSTLAHRMRARMRALDYNQQQLADRARMAQTAVSKILAGKTLRPTRIVDLAMALGTSPEWLLYGKGAEAPGGLVAYYPAPTDGNTAPRDRKILPSESENPPSIGFLTHASGGTLADQDSGFHQEVIMMDVQSTATTTPEGDLRWMPANEAPYPFPTTFFARRQLDPAQCRLLQVVDAAMAPAITPGDLVMIDTARREVVDGEIFALLYMGHLYLRRLYRLPTGGYQVVADNPNHPPFEIPASALGELIVVGHQVYRAG